ncbi:hypothetical protein FBF34_12245 [Arachnia propionica]|nr:hypothetical protein FBF34_12245 [Arachnia propionica]
MSGREFAVELSPRGSALEVRAPWHLVFLPGNLHRTLLKRKLNEFTDLAGETNGPEPAAGGSAGPARPGPQGLGGPGPNADSGQRSGGHRGTRQGDGSPP